MNEAEDGYRKVSQCVRVTECNKNEGHREDNLCDLGVLCGDIKTKSVLCMRACTKNITATLIVTDCNIVTTQDILEV